MAQQEPAEPEDQTEFPVPELIVQIHPDGTCAMTATVADEVVFDATVPVERGQAVAASAVEETIATWSDLVNAAVEQQQAEAADGEREAQPTAE